MNTGRPQKGQFAGEEEDGGGKPAARFAYAITTTAKRRTGVPLKVGKKIPVKAGFD
ncbi:MAG: hypothetical protein GX202_05680 [Firmicutes bacterium]|nr:hypothetical protein [Bacillota bacterium]